MYSIKSCPNPGVDIFVECISGCILLRHYLCCHSHAAAESVLLKGLPLYTSLKGLNIDVTAGNVMWGKAWSSKTLSVCETCFSNKFVILTNCYYCIHFWAVLSFIMNFSWDQYWGGGTVLSSSMHLLYTGGILCSILLKYPLSLQMYCPWHVLNYQSYILVVFQSFTWFA